MCFFCYVNDLVEGIWCLFNSGINELMNIGNLSEMMIFQFVEKIVEFIDVGSEVVFCDLLVDDLKICQFDILFV